MIAVVESLPEKKKQKTGKREINMIVKDFLIAFLKVAKRIKS